MRAQSFVRFASPSRLLLLTFVLSCLAMTSPPGIDSRLPVGLRQAFAQSTQVDYLFVLKDNVDLGGASKIADVKARRQWVYQRLRDQALRSQSAARIILDTAGAKYQSHYLLNALEVHSGQAVAEKLAALPEANHLYEVRPIRAALPVLDKTDTGRKSPESVATVEWNVERVHAPEVWSTFGTRGEGIVVGTADTGVQWDHPALKPHYRGWDGSTADHNYSWHDAVHDASSTPRCPNDSPTPCDGYQPTHGTHVTGTMIGDDGAGNQIGVAPGAQWIGCRNMEDSGDGTIPRYTECFEFMLAPYPFGGDPLSDGNPALAADIVNNSWTCPVSEGCDSLHLNDMVSEIQKLNTAGILVVAAAGNNGSSCSSVDRPIATYAETFAVGATDSGDSIAVFSSRGPVTVDSSNRRKPDISAPGVSVRSTLGGNIYGDLSGTSMASPHVSAVAALLWSAVPSLRGNIDRTKMLLENSAYHLFTEDGCGGDTITTMPNNTFGYGIVDAYQAIACAPAGLCLDKQASSASAQVGDILTYTLRIANGYPMTSTGVLVADSVPTGTTYISGTISGPGADASAAPVLHWNLGDVPPLALSDAITLTFAVSVDPGAGGPIRNRANIASNQTGPKSSNMVITLTPYRNWLPVVVR